MTCALDGVQACVFDAYGTLFDFASAAARCPDVPEDRRAALTTLWRDKQLQYAWLRTLENRYADFCRSPATRSISPWKASTLRRPRYASA